MKYEGVGVLVPDAIYKKIPQLSGNLKAMFLLFEQAAEKNKLLPCYIKLSKLLPNKKSVVAYVKTINGYQLRRVPRPSVIYSRIIDKSQAVRRRIRLLSQDGVTLFNIPNYDVEKYNIHQLLLKDKMISKHLPHTEVLTRQNLQKMMSNYDSLILKQNYGERGIGAMKLEQGNDFWTLTYKTPNMIDFKRVHFSNHLPAILEDHIAHGDYIIQERIKLATYNGAPFDMRVAVQKDGHGKFKVTGIMCKVAKKRHFLTNGSEGGQTYRLEDIHAQAIPKIPLHVLQKTIAMFAIKVACHLEQFFPHLADLGFDICLTKEGTPYFIECNFISDYVSGLFQHQKLLHHQWSAVFTTPFDYARYLLNQKKVKIKQ